MIVFVDWKGEKKPIVVNDDPADVWTQDLFEIMEGRFGYPLDSIQLTLPNGMKLCYGDANDTFETFGVKDSSVLELSFRLRGGGPADSDDEVVAIKKVELSEKAINLCKMITTANYEILDLCRNLKTELENIGVISDVATYDDVKGNVQFCKALLEYVALGLCDSIASSRYGCKVVSDYDLYHRMKTDFDFNNVCKRHNISVGSNDYENLKRNRGNLRRWLARLRDQAILNFELPETPDSREVRSAQKSKKEIEDEAIRKLAQAKVKEDDRSKREKSTKKAKKEGEAKQEGEAEKGGNGNIKEKNKGKFLGRRSSTSKDNSPICDLYETGPFVVEYLTSK
jgi:hypothetical protein